MFEMMYEMIMKVYEVLVEFLGVVMICIFSVIGNFSEMGMDFIGNVVFDMPEPQEVTENKYVDYSDLKDNVLEYSNFEIYKNWSEASLKDKEVFIEAVKNRELSELGVTYEISIKYKELGNIKAIIRLPRKLHVTFPSFVHRRVIFFDIIHLDYTKE